MLSKLKEELAEALWASDYNAGDSLAKSYSSYISYKNSYWGVSDPYLRRASVAVDFFVERCFDDRRKQST